MPETQAFEPQPASQTIRVMSYNIRFDNPTDGENQWSPRKDRVSGLIHYHSPDVLGVQEALVHQVQDLEAALPDYHWYGVGREDGQDKGEFMTIFYRTDRFELVRKDTFWLSPTSSMPSKGWDADVMRVCSWVQLKDRRDGQVFYHFNTHFDHMGTKAREECARLLLEKIPEITGDADFVITGDFNDPPQSNFYQVLTQSDFVHDAKQISQRPHYGPEGTWATFDVRQGVGNQIDFIFVSPRITVLRHAALTDSQNFRYPSDHLPLLAEIRLPPHGHG